MIVYIYIYVPRQLLVLKLFLGIHLCRHLGDPLVKESGAGAYIFQRGGLVL